MNKRNQGWKKPKEKWRKYESVFEGYVGPLGELGNVGPLGELGERP